MKSVERGVRKRTHGLADIEIVIQFLAEYSSGGCTYTIHVQL